MGDGVLAYFGFPRAHEDDAERAVRAGLDLAEAIAKVQTRDGEVLKTRIGVAACKRAPSLAASSLPIRRVVFSVMPSS